MPITVDSVISEIEELEGLLIDMSDFDNSRVLFDEYTIRMWALTSIGHVYPLDQAIRLTEICEDLEPLLPSSSEEMFEQYTVYLNLLGICLEDIRRN